MLESRSVLYLYHAVLKEICNFKTSINGMYLKWSGTTLLYLLNIFDLVMICLLCQFHYCATVKASDILNLLCIVVYFV